MFQTSKRKAILSPSSLIFIVIITLGLSASMVAAHSVSLWVYVEEGRVCVEASAHNGAKIKGGSILVLDAKVKTLHEGVTDDNGYFEFAPSVKEDLTIVLKADGGHRAEFKLKAEDFEVPEKPIEEKAPEKPAKESCEKQDKAE